VSLLWNVMTYIQNTHRFQIQIDDSWLVKIQFNRRIDVFKLMSDFKTNPHWARVVGYGPFSLSIIHKEGLCLSSGDINRLMMMISRKTSEWMNLKLEQNENKLTFCCPGTNNLRISIRMVNVSYIMGVVTIVIQLNALKLRILFREFVSELLFNRCNVFFLQ
jgi:hypothetical protein